MAGKLFPQSRRRPCHTVVRVNAKTDVTLVGTRVVSGREASVVAQDGRIDFQAATNTNASTKTGSSEDVNLQGSATGGGVQVGASRTDESSQSTTKTAGSIDAQNLTLSAGAGVRLEGTQVQVTEHLVLDAGSGALVMESAESSSSSNVNNTEGEAAVGVDVKARGGLLTFKGTEERENSENITQQNVSINVAGSADIKAAGGIDIKGKDVTDVSSVVSAAHTDLNGATVTTEQRQEVDTSSQSVKGVSVGVTAPKTKKKKKKK